MGEVIISDQNNKSRGFLVDQSYLSSRCHGNMQWGSTAAAQKSGGVSDISVKKNHKS